MYMIVHNFLSCFSITGEIKMSKNSRTAAADRSNRTAVALDISRNNQSVSISYLPSRSFYIFPPPYNGATSSKIKTRSCIKDYFFVSYIGFTLILFHFHSKSTIMTSIIKRQNLQWIKLFPLNICFFCQYFTHIFRGTHQCHI